MVFFRNTAYQSIDFEIDSSGKKQICMIPFRRNIKRVPCLACSNDHELGSRSPLDNLKGHWKNTNCKGLKAIYKCRICGKEFKEIKGFQCFFCRSGHKISFLHSRLGKDQIVINYSELTVNFGEATKSSDGTPNGTEESRVKLSYLL